MNALDKAPTPWSPDEDGADLYDRNGKLIATVYLPGDYKPQPKPEDRAAQRELAALVARLVNDHDAIRQTTTCRMCDGRGQEGSPVYRVTVETPEGEETSVFCRGCWEREARTIPVSTWEDSIADTATLQMPPPNRDGV